MNVRVTDTIEPLPSSAPTLPERSGGLGARVWLIIGAVILVVLGIVLWQMFAPSEKPHKPAPPVIVAKVTQQDVAVVEHTIGTVLSPATVQVNARVQGQLLKAYFTEGQTVQAGQLLFQIDPAPYQATLSGALATLASAQVKWTRYAALLAQKAVSPQDADDAKAAYLIAKAAADTARLNLGFTRITSPITGKTGPILIQPGNQIMIAGSGQTGAATSGADTGATALVTITQVQPIKVSFSLPQNDLPQIQAKLRTHALTVGVGPGNTLTAPVDFVSNQVNASAGTIELRATFPNADNALVPGQLLDAGVVLNTIKGATAVPHDAVNAGFNSSYVYVVRHGNAVMVNVKVLHDDGTFAAVQGKLKPGEMVITDGQMRVVAGKPVVVSKPRTKK